VEELSQETILIVDDEPSVLNFCKLILTRGGYRVLEARNGTEGLAAARAAGTRIRLALLDVVMPGMNGFELAEQLHKLDRNMLVVLMSGYSVSEVKRIAGGDHPYRIIWKPFKADSLLRMIETVLDSSNRASM
jgi:DNA-binding NtrC family response regulator